MLKAMKLPLPKQVLVHGWWQKDGEKLSKSTGNVVDPLAVIDEWGLDAFRYYVVRELDIGPDGNWTDAGFRSRYQAELANGLGNLVNRSLSMIKRYRDGLVPRGANQLEKEISETRARVIAAYRRECACRKRWCNADRSSRAPINTLTKPARSSWPKTRQRAGELNDILHTLAEVCRALGTLLWPVIPGVAEKSKASWAFPKTGTTLAEATAPIPEGHPIGEVFPLFPRKDV